MSHNLDVFAVCHNVTCNLRECSPAMISTKAAKNFFSMMISTNAEVDKSVSGAGLEYQVSECSWFYRLCLCRRYVGGGWTRYDLINQLCQLKQLK